MALRTADGRGRSLDEAAAAPVTEDKYSVIFNPGKGGENENKGLEDGEGLPMTNCCCHRVLLLFTTTSLTNTFSCHLFDPVYNVTLLVMFSKRRPAQQVRTTPQSFMLREITTSGRGRAAAITPPARNGEQGDKGAGAAMSKLVNRRRHRGSNRNNLNNSGLPNYSHPPCKDDSNHIPNLWGTTD